MSAGIDKLLIRGIRSFSPYEENVIEFYSPLTIIVGQNGCGKTTIIECLKYVTTGDLPPNSKGGAFVHDPNLSRETEVKGQIKLKFHNVNQQLMVCTRSLQSTQKKTKIEQKTLESLLSCVDPLTGEQQSISSRSSELDLQVPAMLGVSKSILENVIFCHQEDSFWPLSEPSILKKKFDDIFASTRYTKALDTIRALRKEMGQELRLEEERLLHHYSRTTQLKALEDQFLTSQARLDEAADVINSLETKDIPLLRAEKQALFEELEAKKKLTDLLQQKEAEVNLLRQQCANIQNSPSFQRLEHKDLEALKKELQRHEEANSSKIGELAHLEEELHLKERRVEELESSLKESRLTFLRNELQRKQLLEEECMKELFGCDGDGYGDDNNNNNNNHNNKNNNADKSLQDIMKEKIIKLQQEKARLTQALKEEKIKEDQRLQERSERDLRQNTLKSQKTHLSELIKEKNDRISTLQSLISDASDGGESDSKTIVSTTTTTTPTQPIMEEILLSEKKEQHGKIESLKNEIISLLPKPLQSPQHVEKRLKELAEVETRIERHGTLMMQWEMKRDDLSDRRSDLLKKVFPTKIEPLFKKLSIDPCLYAGLCDDFVVVPLCDGDVCGGVVGCNTTNTTNTTNIIISNLEGKLLLLKEQKRTAETMAQDRLDRLKTAAQKRLARQSHIKKEIKRQHELLSTNRRSIKRCLEQNDTNGGGDGGGAASSPTTNFSSEAQPELSLKLLLKSLEDQLASAEEALENEQHNQHNDDKSCPLCKRTFPPEKEMSWEEMELILSSKQKGGCPLLKEKIRAVQAVLPKALECVRITSTIIPSLEEEYHSASGGNGNGIGIGNDGDGDSFNNQIATAEENLHILKDEMSALFEEQLPTISSFLKDLNEISISLTKLQAPAKDFSVEEEEECLRLQHCIELIAPLQKALHAEEDVWHQREALLAQSALQRQRISEWRQELQTLSASLLELERQFSLVVGEILEASVTTTDTDTDTTNNTCSKESQLREELEQLAKAELALEGVRQKWRIAEEISVTKETVAVAAERDLAFETEIASAKITISTLKGHLEHQRKEGNTLLVERRNLEDNIQLMELHLQCSKGIGALEEMHQKERQHHSIDFSTLHLKSEQKEEELMGLLGRKSGLAGEIRQLETKIHEVKTLIAPLKKARQDHKAATVGVHTIKAAMQDLEQYGKALDMAILRFHGQRMAEINRIIREIWQDTYQGADIDSIEIRTEKDGGSGGGYNNGGYNNGGGGGGSAAKNNNNNNNYENNENNENNNNIIGPRSYAYRVVMMKGGVELDMRGRSSAGQRVLASLIIRLALAETFGQQCSILALDEPTTNLDRENIESLAASLYSIIKGREGSRFQLIIITHDEEFVDLLGRHECASWYWRVGRDDRQYSRIERQSFTNEQ